jgi:hypothetical protein
METALRWNLVADGTLVQDDRSVELSGPYDDGAVEVSVGVDSCGCIGSRSFSLDRDARVAWIGWLVKHTKLTDVEAMALDLAVRGQ